MQEVTTILRNPVRNFYRNLLESITCGDKSYEIDVYIGWKKWDKRGLNMFNKGRIIESLKLRKSFTEVTNELNVHPTTVSRYVRNMVQNESLERKEGSGRPRILGQETWKSITSFVVLMLKRKDGMSCSTIQDHINETYVLVDD